MTINNPELFDAVIAGIAISSGAWLSDVKSSDYAAEANAAVAIASEVDAGILPIAGGITLSQRSVMEGITRNCMSGRAAISVQPSDYSMISQGIIAVFTQFITRTMSSDSAVGNSIFNRKIKPNGGTNTDVALSTNNSTSILSVLLTTANLALSTIYQTTIRSTVVFYEDSSPEITGSVDLTSDMTVTVDPAGNIFCGFSATQSPDLSRLVGTALSGATVSFSASANGFTINATRPSGIACHARCTWTTNYFESVGVASDIPQAGTWSTGGYWDVDHGIGGTPNSVSSISSREGTSVLSTSGGTIAITNDPISNTNVITCGAASLNETASGKWGAFGGIKVPFILFLQLSTQSVVSAESVLNIHNSGNTARAANPTFTNPTQLACYQYDGTNIPFTVGIPITASERITTVFVLHTDGKLYTIDSGGTSNGSACATLSIVVDRIILTGTPKWRRWGVKLPSTANPLIEGQLLYNRVATLT